jgi:hypothetical protein
MATLLPALSSDEEDNTKALEEKDDVSSGDEVDEEFSFGGILVGCLPICFLCETSLGINSFSLSYSRERTVETLHQNGWDREIQKAGLINLPCRFWRRMMQP